MDVVRELRGAAKNPYMDNTCKLSVVVVIGAADEIEKLRKEIELLHNIVANVRKDVRDGLYKYEMEKDPTGVKNIKWEKD